MSANVHAAATPVSIQRFSIAREFLFQQAPLIAAALILGYVAAYLQHV
jgi:hypothetical protein